MTPPELTRCERGHHHLHIQLDVLTDEELEALEAAVHGEGGLRLALMVWDCTAHRSPVERSAYGGATVPGELTGELVAFLEVPR